MLVAMTTIMINDLTRGGVIMGSEPQKQNAKEPSHQHQQQQHSSNSSSSRHISNNSNSIRSHLGSKLLGETRSLVAK